jgi:hypothetical protein
LDWDTEPSEEDERIGKLLGCMEEEDDNGDGF